MEAPPSHDVFPAPSRERTLIRGAPFLLALAFLASPARGIAQQAAAREAYASVAAAVATTQIHEHSATMLGGTALLSLGGRLAFGGGGWVMTKRSTVEGQTAGARYDFRMAYGGVAAQARLLGNRNHGLELRALVGAGNGKVRLPVVGTLIAADNFGVVEPALAGTVRLFPGVHLQGSVAWRWAFGVQDLPGVSTDDLRGFSARLGFAIRNF